MEKRKSIFDYVKKKLEVVTITRVLGINYEGEKKRYLLEKGGMYRVVEERKIKDGDNYRYELRHVCFTDKLYKAYDKLFERK